MTDGGIATILVLIGLVAAAYLMAHWFAAQFQRRFLVVTGIEYIVLGVILGPKVLPELRALADLTALGPVIAFSAGWVGLLYGLEATPSEGGGLDRSSRLAVVEGSVTASLVGLVSYQLLMSGWLVPDVDTRSAMVAAFAMGCTAAAASSSAVDLVQERYRAIETELLPLLRRAARLGDLIAIAGFGLLFCIFHEGQTLTATDLRWSEWILLTGGLGVSLGLLFVVFLGETTDANHKFLALSGILIFAAGAAFFLKISALLVNLILGVVIARASSHGNDLHQVLEGTQAPVRIVLLVFAGALWTPVDPLAGLALAAAYILLRAASKSAGGMLATWGTPVRSDVFRGMMAQGDVAVAMAIGFRLVYSGPVADLAYTAILAGVVVHELVAPRLLKGLLVDAGELRSDVGTLQPAPARVERG